MAINVNAFFTLIAAAALYWLGDWLVRRLSLVRRYCIPAPLVGGALFAVANTYLYTSGQDYFVFDSVIQSVFMVVFFTAAGFAVRMPLLRQGGKAVIRVLVLAAALTLAQNVLGIGVLATMGADPRLGLAVGSMSLMGGPATAAAFGPMLDAAGAAGSSAAGLIAAVLGVISGGIFCNRLHETEVEAPDSRPDVNRVISCIALMLFCMGTSYILIGAFSAATGFSVPWFVGSMLLAAVVRNTTLMTDEEIPDREAQAASKVCFGLFVTMAMMNLRIWELAELSGPLAVALAAQIILLVWFIGAMVRPRMADDTAGILPALVGSSGETSGSAVILLLNAFVVSAMIPIVSLFV